MATATASMSASCKFAAEGFVYDGQDPFDVGPRGDLGDDAAESLVERILRGDDGTEHVELVGDDGGGRFVAGGFNREDVQGEQSGVESRR